MNYKKSYLLPLCILFLFPIKYTLATDKKPKKTNPSKNVFSLQTWITRPVNGFIEQTIDDLNRAENINITLKDGEYNCLFNDCTFKSNFSDEKFHIEIVTPQGFYSNMNKVVRNILEASQRDDLKEYFTDQQDNTYTIIINKGFTNQRTITMRTDSKNNQPTDTLTITGEGEQEKKLYWFFALKYQERIMLESAIKKLSSLKSTSKNLNALA